MCPWSWKGWFARARGRLCAPAQHFRGHSVIICCHGHWCRDPKPPASVFAQLYSLRMFCAWLRPSEAIQGQMHLLDRSWGLPP
eukprot:6678995-Alexandrium_andersonii.AAC.1